MNCLCHELSAGVRETGLSLGSSRRWRRQSDTAGKRVLEAGSDRLEFHQEILRSRCQIQAPGVGEEDYVISQLSDTF